MISLSDKILKFSERSSISMTVIFIPENFSKILVPLKPHPKLLPKMNGKKLLSRNIFLKRIIP